MQGNRVQKPLADNGGGRFVPGLGGPPFRGGASAPSAHTPGGCQETSGRSLEGAIRADAARPWRPGEARDERPAVARAPRPPPAPPERRPDADAPLDALADGIRADAARRGLDPDRMAGLTWLALCARAVRRAHEELGAAAKDLEKRLAASTAASARVADAIRRYDETGRAWVGRETSDAFDRLPRAQRRYWRARKDFDVWTAEAVNSAREFASRFGEASPAMDHVEAARARAGLPPSHLAARYWQALAERDALARRPT